MGDEDINNNPHQNHKPDNKSSTLTAYQPNYSTFASKKALVNYQDSDSDSTFYSNSRSGNPYLPFNGSKHTTSSFSKNSSTTTELTAEAKAKIAAKETLEAKH